MRNSRDSRAGGQRAAAATEAASWRSDSVQCTDVLPTLWGVSRFGLSDATLERNLRDNPRRMLTGK